MIQGSHAHPEQNPARDGGKTFEHGRSEALPQRGEFSRATLADRLDVRKRGRVGIHGYRDRGGTTRGEAADRTEWLPFGHALCPGEICTAEFARREFLTDVMIGEDAELLSVAGDVVIHWKGDRCI